MVSWPSLNDFGLPAVCGEVHTVEKSDFSIENFERENFDGDFQVGTSMT